MLSILMFSNFLNLNCFQKYMPKTLMHKIFFFWHLIIIIKRTNTNTLRKLLHFKNLTCYIVPFLFFTLLEVNEDVLWLTLHREPWEMVIEKWNVTYNIRSRQNLKIVSDFLKAWPILQHLQSEVLVCILYIIL